MSGKTTPLYVVCSPCRCDGKTLVSRLFTEFYALGDRPVAAFDLGDEGPQLADYLPQFTTIADINDVRGQMTFFEQLIAENDGAKIIDVSHRTFNNFFRIVEEISLFEEARRHSIEPLILFIIDADSKSPEAYATIRRRLTEASLLPVRNMAEAMAVSTWNKPPKAHTAPALLQVPLLSFALRAFVDRQYFSFSEFCRTKPANLPDAMDDELQDWVECVFSQIRDLELCLGCECTPTCVAPASRQSRTIHRAPQRDAQPLGGDAQHTIDAVEAVLKFAPRKLRGQTAEDRIDQLKAEIKQWQDRAVRAETRLQSVQKLIQEQIKRVPEGGRTF